MKHVTEKFSLIKKIIDKFYESKNKAHFGTLCNAINPNAIIDEGLISQVWDLLSTYKDNTYKPMMTIINNADFQDLVFNLSNQVDILTFVKTYGRDRSQYGITK